MTEFTEHCLARQYHSNVEMIPVVGIVNTFFKTRIAKLQEEGITKLRFVLDGANMPGKGLANNRRDEKRQAALESI